MKIYKRGTNEEYNGMEIEIDENGKYTEKMRNFFKNNGFPELTNDNLKYFHHSKGDWIIVNNRENKYYVKSKYEFKKEGYVFDEDCIVKTFIEKRNRYRGIKIVFDAQKRLDDRSREYLEKNKINYSFSKYDEYMTIDSTHKIPKTDEEYKFKGRVYCGDYIVEDIEHPGVFTIAESEIMEFKFVSANSDYDMAQMPLEMLAELSPMWCIVNDEYYDSSKAGEIVEVANLVSFTKGNPAPEELEIMIKDKNISKLYKYKIKKEKPKLKIIKKIKNWLDDSPTYRAFCIIINLILIMQLSYYIYLVVR